MLGKLSVPGVLLIWIIVEQGPTAGTCTRGCRVANFQCRQSCSFG